MEHWIDALLGGDEGHVVEHVMFRGCHPCLLPSLPTRGAPSQPRVAEQRCLAAPLQPNAILRAEGNLLRFLSCTFACPHPGCPPPHAIASHLFVLVVRAILSLFRCY